MGSVDLMDHLMESYCPTIHETTGPIKLNLVCKLSQHYSCCSMEDTLLTWPAKSIILPGILETGDLLLA